MLSVCKKVLSSNLSLTCARSFVSINDKKVVCSSYGNRATPSTQPCTIFPNEFPSFSTISFGENGDAIHSISPLSSKRLQPNNIQYSLPKTNHTHEQFQREIEQWVALNPKTAPYKAEESLAKMWVKQQESINQYRRKAQANNLRCDVLLTVDVVNLVLQAWCNSNNGKIGAMRAERLLRWMEGVDSSVFSEIGWDVFSLRPNYQSYSTVIDAWSRAAVCESYNSVFNKTQRNHRDIPEATKIGFECARHAEDILMHMQKMHDQRLNNKQLGSYSSEIQPDTQVFHLVLKGWCNVGGGTKASAIRATRILDLMQELHHYQSLQSPTWQGIAVSKVQPNLETYKLLLKAWAHTYTQEGADRAEEILRHLFSISKAGNVDKGIKPDEECFHIVMKAHAESVRKRRKSLNPEHVSSADRARQVTTLLDWMELLAMRRVAKIQPTAETYRIAMSAWAWSYDVNAPREVERILFRMIRAHEVSNVDGAIDKILTFHDQGKNERTINKLKPWISGPETRDFNTVINCCAFARGVGKNVKGLDSNESMIQHEQLCKEIFLIAEGAFDALLSMAFAKPDSATFVGMIRACLHLLPDTEERDERVIEIFRLAYKTPPPSQPTSSQHPSLISERLRVPPGAGCVNAIVLRQLRLALPSTEEYIRVREEFEQYRSQNNSLMQ